MNRLIGPLTAAALLVTTALAHAPAAAFPGMFQAPSVFPGQAPPRAFPGPHPQSVFPQPPPSPWRFWGAPLHPEIARPFPGMIRVPHQRRQAFWVPEHWAWNGWEWVWIPGHWE